MLIEKFIEYLQIEKKYSVNTLAAYKKDLTEFQLFIYQTGKDLCCQQYYLTRYVV